LQQQCPGTRLPDSYAAGRGSICFYSFFPSIFARVGKILGEFIAEAEEHLVGSLSLERRMRHDFIVGLHVELDEAPKSGDRI